MADYPAHLVQERTLRDGRRVVIRPVRSDDAESIARFLNELRPESRYLRFQKWSAVAPERLIRFLIDVDHDRHFAFVCAARCGDREVIVGDARYVAAPGADSCDFGIVIADAWHKTGIAGLLMAALIKAAAERGFATMESQVLHANREMLHFARALGFEVQASRDDETMVRIVRKLRDKATQRERQLGKSQPAGKTSKRPDGLRAS